MRNKIGRGRVYGCDLRDGASFGTALDELRERVIDQIDDMSTEELVFRAPGTTISCAWLALHLARSEAYWVGRITGAVLSPEMETALKPGDLAALEKGLDEPREAVELTRLIRRVAREVVDPVLADLGPLDSRPPVLEKWGMTIRDALLHILWHWTYHSGQIGLVRLQAGADYEWKFATLKT